MLTTKLYYLLPDTVLGTSSFPSFTLRSTLGLLLKFFMASSDISFLGRMNFFPIFLAGIELF